MIEKEPKKRPEESNIESELDTEKYRKYFDILRRNDAPMANNFPYFEGLAKGLPTEKLVHDADNDKIYKTVPVESEEEARQEKRRYIEGLVAAWTIIKNIYDGINLSEQDENTGKAILQENKNLIDKFHPLFMEVVELALKNPELPPDIPKELVDLRDRILKNALIYGELSAVRTYEEVGRKGTIDPSVATRSEWFRAGKPTNKEWFEKWFGK